MGNILAVSQELVEQGYPKMIEIPEALLYALIGFSIVFLGIAFLIAIVWGVGKFMQMKNGTPKKVSVPSKTVEKASTTPTVSNMKEEELDEETVAVITAAIMAYYEQTSGPKCEFRVKRIKRI